MISRTALVHLAHFPLITYKRYHALEQQSESISSINSIEDITTTHLKKARWSQKTIAAFFDWKKVYSFSKAESLQRQWGIRIISLLDEDYPPLLRQIFDPPLCLFIRGTLCPHKRPLAIVGTRKITAYGAHATKQIISGLPQTPISIVSGLALGVDAVAHQTALAHDIHTIAVLPGGLTDYNIAPQRHRTLAQKIINTGGALISEYPPNTPITQYSFPKRNRIVAGLSSCTLVIEAPKKSGALITAQCSIDLGRDVLTIPHPIDSPMGAGPHTLIKEGAQLITSAGDLLSYLSLSSTIEAAPQIMPNLPVSSEESTILRCLDATPIHIDVLAKSSNISPSVLLPILLTLEVQGRIRKERGMYFCLVC